MSDLTAYPLYDLIAFAFVLIGVAFIVGVIINRFKGGRKEKLSDRVVELEQELARRDADVAKAVAKVESNYQMAAGVMGFELEQCKDALKEKTAEYQMVVGRLNLVEDTMRAAAKRMRKVPPAWLQPDNADAETPTFQRAAETVQVSAPPVDDFGEHTGGWATDILAHWQTERDMDVALHGGAPAEELAEDDGPRPTRAAKRKAGRQRR